MSRARRLARWLRLVVTCLAFVIGAPAPAVAVEAFDQIAFVEGLVEEAAPEEGRAEHSATAAADAPGYVEATSFARPFEPPRLVSRRYIENCALLL